MRRPRGNSFTSVVIDDIEERKEDVETDENTQRVLMDIASAPVQIVAPNYEGYVLTGSLGGLTLTSRTAEKVNPETLKIEADAAKIKVTGACGVAYGMTVYDWKKFKSEVERQLEIIRLQKVVKFEEDQLARNRERLIELTHPENSGFHFSS